MTHNMIFFRASRDPKLPNIFWPHGGPLRDTKPSETPSY